MEWEPDVSAGEWLRERIDQPWRGTMHDLVPRGFAAYARIFHPATRDRPVGTAWPTAAYSDHRAWERFHDAHPDLQTVTERVSWATTAAALGTVFHPEAQWSALTRVDARADRVDDPRDADGWRYADPEMGGMPADLVSALAEVLAAATTTPTEGGVALWEGRAALVGHLGHGPSRVFFQMGDGADPDLARHNAMLGTAARDVLNRVFRKPTWQEGILSRDISEGPRLALPERNHVLFRGGVAELVDPAWELRMPWRDRPSEAQGFPPSAQSPSLVWPADRAWVWVSEVDWDSTVVGGSAELIRAVCADPRLEALPLGPDADLSWDGDGVNR
ncbi:hypothetical protein N3K63_04255 [Microbacterium sp. W1N]|uniref:hypothetical protein n=1 Tax=Microbacterium festucae TaxID=2977531 RepID=UPI0021BEF13E|nr:hypothetical protein [Microbacterium festucae]MCT9819495.1 hypothetical protein [Microbacterium festucae]